MTRQCFEMNGRYKRGPTIDAFNERYIPEPNSGCWLWTSTINPHSNRAVIRCGGFRGYASRFAFSHFKHPIPTGALVLHRCDNPYCVNPDHLFLGSHGDNAADRAAKNRSAKGARSGQSKLTEAAVHEIRSISWGVPYRIIGNKFGVSASCIRSIIERRTWTHLGEVIA